MQQHKKFCHTALSVIETEAAAISSLSSRIDANFVQACDFLLNCTGRIVVIGMGKSGHIAKKIAATFASTGSPAFFVHAGEASHGDMGKITTNDVILAISNSGKTPEMLAILPSIKQLNIPLITLTGNRASPLALAATINLDVSVEKEACPLGLAPTASTTACLVMGDALAVAIYESRGFTPEDFALTHPGGDLGRRLLLKIVSIMHSNNDIPKVKPDVTIVNALLEMTKKRLGMTTIVSESQELLGIYTDGDLRRSLNEGIDIHQTLISDVMTKNFKSIQNDALAVQALEVMENYKITCLVVVSPAKELVGVVHLHDLFQAGVK